MDKNETMADVQPGGRVRLGDGHVTVLREIRARFTDAGSPARTAALDAAIAALSAQPSPGGQGVGVSISDDDRAVLQRLQDALPTAGINGWAKGVEVLERLLRDSLAARQPVGEPVSEAIEQLADDVESCVSDACGYLASDSGWDDYGIYRDDAKERYRALPGRIRALAAPPAQAVDLGAVRDAVHGITLGFDGDLPYIKGIAEAQALIDSQAVGK